MTIPFYFDIVSLMQNRDNAVETELAAKLKVVDARHRIKVNAVWLVIKARDEFGDTVNLVIFAID